jgi:hypothetical protein
MKIGLVLIYSLGWKQSQQHAKGATPTDLNNIHNLFILTRLSILSVASLGRHTGVNGGHYTGGSKVPPSQIVSGVPMCSRQ